MCDVVSVRIKKYKSNNFVVLLRMQNKFRAISLQNLQIEALLTTLCTFSQFHLRAKKLSLVTL